ncbi:hypothetical protein [Kineococcus rubinsiae]|uniref:hypothetical protein n=1 Tax=Kineococcus rubinsiae TaxID=2609562 RepID=UPI001430779E|nr:hypothetical protein [Kineococcus rubinsiae]NIZ89995.1 hypothetical protein [Kineococcus rubinsiae]
MTSLQRRPALELPPVSRASRWVDADAANRWTTQTLRANEARLRAAAARRESAVEFRAPVPASAGTLFVRTGEDVEERDVSCAVVRMDLSGPAPVVRASLPEDLPLFEDAWELLQVLTRFREDAVEDWLDPRQALDEALAADPERAGAAAAQWIALTGGGPDAVTAHQVVEAATGAATAPVEGLTWSAWADWFTAHLQQVARGEVSPPRDTSPPDLVRTGEFDRAVDVGAVVEEVLDLRSDDVTAWLSLPDQPRRLHVWADLGRVLGSVTTDGPALDVAATAAVVVGQRREDGTLEVLDASPEVPLDDGLRSRLPVAASVLGAWFGPSSPRLDVRPWPAQRALLAGEPAVVLDAWRREAGELLALDDTDLRHALLRLGSAVVPAGTRGWLERLLWRMDAFPLTGTA